LHVGSPLTQLFGLAIEQVPIDGCAGSGTQMTRPEPGRPFGSSPPQQSVFLVQRSPSTWQPDAGWQTLVVPVPNGAQYELQQPLQPSQVRPSTRQGVVIVAQVPAVAPDAIVQTPVQHSALWKQMSPGCVQYDTVDGASHVIEVGLHLPLQQFASAVQALPAVEQVALSGLHVPLSHCWLQHELPPAVHG